MGLLSASRSNWGEEFIKPNGATMMGCFGSRHRYGDTPTLQGGSVSMEDAPTIDVYWVSDTGGCLLLIAYMHSQWARWKVPCQLVSVFFFVDPYKSLVWMIGAEEVPRGNRWREARAKKD